jgi:hypothetical protein
VDRWLRLKNRMLRYPQARWQMKLLEKQQVPVDGPALRQSHQCESLKKIRKLRALDVK